MRRIVICLSLAAAFVVGGDVPSARACLCNRVTDEQIAARASAVFVGTPVSNRHFDRRDDRLTRWRFAVETVVKGAIHRTTDVWTVGPRPDARFVQTSSCDGVTLEAGRRYWLVAVEREGRLSAVTDLCGGTKILPRDAFIAGAQPLPGVRVLKEDIRVLEEDMGVLEESESFASVIPIVWLLGVLFLILIILTIQPRRPKAE